MTGCVVDNCGRAVVARGMCNMHYRRWWRSQPRKPRPSALERFMEKIDRSGDCWVWLAKSGEDGYGRFYCGGGRLNARYTLAHRFSYEAFVGPIPDGLEIDHLCRNRACVNPEHLEAVTHSVNVWRGDAPLRNRLKTHCPNGHPYDEQNTLLEQQGRARRCRICRRKRVQARRARKRAQGLAA